MRGLEWDNMGVKVDCRYLHHLRFSDDIVLITSSINQAGRMVAEFDETCEKIGLQLNLDKTVFLRNRCVCDAPFTLNGMNISECSSCLYLGRKISMMDGLRVGQKETNGWEALTSIGDVGKGTTNTLLRAHLFNTAVLPALIYASETWAFRNQEKNVISVMECGIERITLGETRFTQVKEWIRSSLPHQRSKIGEVAAYFKGSKIRWAGHAMHFNDNRWTRAVSDWIPRKRTADAMVRPLYGVLRR
ncbi:hypothetical protein RB195_016076 [Necator americanus]|uniref:Reverse transcriptase domain-containing protein n=1 Tax=Necator americanus TaxID=51031 RepID=A0ABR1E7V1_NECAM